MEADPDLLEFENKDPYSYNNYVDRYFEKCYLTVRGE